MMWKLGLLCLVAVLAGAYAQAPNDDCPRFNSSCDECINEGHTTNASVNLRCFWCGATHTCSLFEFNTAIPINGIECPQLRYNVGTCALDALAIIIIIAVACFVVVVLLCCCCCCCCIWCANRRKRVRMVEEQHHLEEKDAIRQKSAERRAERKAKHDEIRRKYGLQHDDPAAGTYKRLD